ncbi:hypothetical protein KFE25_009388 [Diacronema lutheri]|uniref:CGL160/ATPI domain-containing protein n=1 Tax=Diacronema lutheri TaxID=2081491 RepID=A0A8J5XY78_DIALT|nr:hypothetical protein KFE25_009388 [Diacronema lutheri]
MGSMVLVLGAVVARAAPPGPARLSLAHGCRVHPVMLAQDEPAANAARLSEQEIEERYAPSRFQRLDAEAQKQRGEYLDEYARQKRGMLADQLFFTALGAAAVFAIGDLSMLAGFGVGSIAAFFYLVLLQRSVDAVGNPEAGLRRGPPPIVVVILFMAIVGKNHEQLALFPALAGFGTYKLATIAQAAVPASSEDRRIVGR